MNCFIFDCAGWLLLHRLFSSCVTWGYSLLSAHGLLIAVASFVAEHGFSGTQASIVVAHGLSCSMACGIFPDQGLNPFLLHWQVDSLPLSDLESPLSKF